jgi:Protein of unknown function (DUF1838)
MSAIGSSAQLSRRTALCGCGTLLLAHAGEGMANPDTSHEHVAAFARLQGHGFGVTGYNYSRGVVTALIDGRNSVPLLGVDGISLDRFTASGDGNFDRDVVQVMLFRDLVNDHIIDKWTNPITNEIVDVVHFFEGPRQFRLTPNGYQNRQTGAPVGTPRPFLLDQRRIGNTIFFTKRTILSYPNFVQPADHPRASTGTTDYVTEEHVFVAAAGEFDDRLSDNVACSFSFTAVFNFFPFMMLGGVNGRMLWTAHGRKFTDVQALPQDTRGAIQAQFPGLLQSPFDQPPRNSFRDFANSLKQR